MGPRGKNEIPMKVENNGQLSNDINVVFNRWKQDFDSLYNKTNEGDVNYDDEFYNEILQRIRERELEVTSDIYIR